MKIKVLVQSKSERGLRLADRPGQNIVVSNVATRVHYAGFRGNALNNGLALENYF